MTTSKAPFIPPDDLIDRWGDLPIPWTQKAKMIAAWGAAHSPVNGHDYAFIYAKVARHVAAADALLNYDAREAGKELQAAMTAIAAFEATTATIRTALNPHGGQPTYWDGWQLTDQSNNHLPIHDD